jgi:hypothetical protein
MFNRLLLVAIIFWGVISFGAAGCNKSRRTVLSAAPITTYTVTFIDNFNERDREELLLSVAAIFSALNSDKPSVVYNFTITITNTEVNLNKSHHNILNFSGSENECPGLFTRICERLGDNSPRHRERDRQLCEDNRRRNNRRE